MRGGRAEQVLRLQLLLIAVLSSWVLAGAIVRAALWLF